MWTVVALLLRRVLVSSISKLNKIKKIFFSCIYSWFRSQRVDCYISAVSDFVNEEDGSSIALGILLLFILGMFILENFTKEKYFRYVFTIFPVFVFALSGLVVKLSASDAKRNLIIAGVELGVSIVCLITRIVLSIFRLSSGNRDYYPTKKSAKIDLLDDYQ